MYKKASQLGLRFSTSRGELTVEQLWHLGLTELDQLAVSLQEQYKESGGKSFLVKKTSKDAEIGLRFDIVKDILTTKMEDRERSFADKETKQHNEKILNLIADKEDDALKGKSVSELKKMLKK